MGRYIRKPSTPEEVEAMQWDGTMEGWRKIVEWVYPSKEHRCSHLPPVVRYWKVFGGDPTINGLSVGDWIIKSVNGKECMPPHPHIFNGLVYCRAEEFEKDYEPATNLCSCVAAGAIIAPRTLDGFEWMCIKWDDPGPLFANPNCTTCHGKGKVPIQE